MNRTSTPAAALALGALAALSGCLPEILVQSRTRVLPDGTITRETTYTKTRANAGSDDEKQWNARPIVEDLGKGVGDGFATLEKNDDVLKFAGVFQDAGKMPSDFRRDVPLIGSTSANRASLVREDILIGTRFLYREQYQDAIAPKDQKDARRELVQWLVGFVKVAAKHEFSERWDAGAFDRWCDADLAKLVDDVIGIYWNERRTLDDVDPHTGRTGLDRAMEKVIARLAKFGVEIHADFDGKSDANVAAIRSFVTRLLAAKLKPKSGATTARPDDFAYLFPQEHPWSGLEIAMDRACEKEFGGKEEAGKALSRMLLGLTGTFGSPPAEAQFHFDCTVEMPGELLRTNGVLDTGTTVFWVFEGEDVYPDGFRIETESVSFDPTLPGRIRELVPQFGKRDAMRVIAALEGLSGSDRTRLRETFELCLRAGTLDPPGIDEETAARVKSLKNVLAGVTKRS